jgi:hypothetical protein
LYSRCADPKPNRRTSPVTRHPSPQYTDQKKLYLALLGILQRSDRGDLLADTLRVMAKKFSGSCKVGGGGGLERGSGGQGVALSPAGAASTGKNPRPPLSSSAAASSASGTEGARAPQPPEQPRPPPGLAARH